MTYTNPYRGGGSNQESLTSTDILYEGSVVVFDEAHNIDNVCIEALSVNINRSVMEGALRNLSQLAEKIEEYVVTDCSHPHTHCTSPGAAFFAVLSGLCMCRWSALEDP